MSVVSWTSQSGVTTWPKDDEPRDIAMSPRLRSHLEIMPRLSPEILFPTPRSRYMRRSTWSAHWHSVRASAQMPGLEFYELRHRAIQGMIDPPHDGGLGLDIQSAAHMILAPRTPRSPPGLRFGHASRPMSP